MKLSKKNPSKTQKQNNIKSQVINEHSSFYEPLSLPSRHSTIMHEQTINNGAINSFNLVTNKLQRSTSQLNWNNVKNKKNKAQVALKNHKLGGVLNHNSNKPQGMRVLYNAFINHSKPTSLRLGFFNQYVLTFT